MIYQSYITIHNKVAKVMFLHLSVCPLGGSASVHGGIPAPQAYTPLGAGTPWSRHPPLREQAPSPVCIILH